MEHEETYLDLMMSLPHWGFELTLELLTAVIVYPLIRIAHKRLTERLHRDLDAEHGVVHQTGSTHSPIISHVRLRPAVPMQPTGPDAEVFVK